MDVFIKEIVVKSEDIDFNGHVNNLKYLEWMINTAMKHSAKNGFDEEFYKKEGSTWFAKSHKIEYKKPAFEGEKLTIKTWIDSIKRVIAVRKYEIYKNNDLIAKGESEWVFVDSKTHRPKRIPQEIIKNFLETPKSLS